MANNTKIDLDKHVLSLGESFEALWENINEKFARKSDNTIPTRTVFVYKTSTSQPGKPIGGSWDNKTNEIVYPRNNPDDLDQEHTWGGADNIERPIWMSVKTFATEPAAETDWSLPTMISGENGAPGADGLSREFVYKLTKTEFEVPGGDDPDYAENLPSEQVNGFVPDGWRDRPTGISEEYRAEWQLTRTKQEDGTWSKWSGPFLWSKYGVNGQDGDSVEYIYARTKTTNEFDGIKVTTPPVIPGYDIESDEYQGKGAYYGKEYIPDGWSDNPLDVDDEWMWCWVSQRKKKDNKWQAFSNPTLWAKYGETGKSGYTVMTLYKSFPIEDTYDVVANEVDTINNSFNDPDIEDINPVNMNWVSAPQFNDEMNLWAISGIWDLINNKLADGEEWQGPYFVSAARTLSTPNFQINVFAQADFTVKESANINIADHIAKPEDGINYDDEFEDGEYVAVGGMGTSQIRTTWTLTPKGEVGTSADSKMWFTCVGVVNGVTRTVKWGEMNRYNAMDGDAGGKYIEYRYAASEHPDIQPETDMCWDGMGDPVWIPGHLADDGVTWIEDWVLSDPLVQGKTIDLETQNYSSAIEASKSMSSGKLIKVLETETITPEGGNSETYYPGLYLVVEPGKITKFRQYVWQIWAFKDLQKNEFVNNGSYGWQGPVRISGEPGESIMGDVGPSGVPGANFSPLYMKGDADGPEMEWDDSLVHLEESALISMGWNQTPPQVDAQFPYVWCTQAKMVWDYNEDKTNMVQKVDKDGWCVPFRMSGLNVMDQPGAITLYAVLDNPADTVICDAEGNVPQSNLGIKTTFKVYKGTSEKYVKSLVVDGEVDGVEYTIENATLIVNRITSTEDKIYIPLRATVDDLGQELSYRTVFSISKLYAGAPTIAVDFGNENITVPATTDGILEDGVLPIETSLHVYLGTSEVSVYTVDSTDCTYSVNNGVLTIERIPNFINDAVILNFDIIFNKDGKEYTKSAQLRVVKVKQGRDSIIYELSTNSNAIRRTQDNQLAPASLDVVVLKKTGDGNVTTLDMHQIQSFGKVVYSVDDSPFEDFPMSGSLTLDQSLDLEQKLELKLVSNQDQNKYLDKDTLYLLHDGLPAVQYSLVVNRDVVQYDENGRASNTESIICDLIKVDGSSYEKVYGVPVGYDLEYSIDGGRSKPYSPSTAIAYNEFEQILEFRFYTSINGERVLVDYDKVVVMKPTKGDRGRIIYPAGIYDPNKTYITDKEKAPYVLDSSDKKFYVLAKETSWNGTVNNGQTPSQNAASELVEPVWEAFEMFEAIYAQIGVFNQALVGSAVFYEEFVFSQAGRDAKGNPSTNYELFNPDDPYGVAKEEGFYPSICFNFVSGAFWLGGNRISYDPVENTINLKGVKMKWSDIEDLPEDFEKLATTAGQSATQAEAYANMASERAKATNDRVDDWANDGMISPTEQSALKDKKAEMTAEYNKIISDINNFNNSVLLEGNYKVSTEGIELAYNKACAAIDYHSNSANEPTDNENVAIKDAESDGDIRFSNIAAYYAALVETTDIYAKKSADYAEALANAYTDGQIEDAVNGLKEIIKSSESNIDQKIEAAKTLITAQYTQKIADKEKELQDAIAAGDEVLAKKIQDEIKRLEDTQNTMQSALTGLEGRVNSLESGEDTEGLTEEQVKQIIETTLIDGTDIGPDYVVSNNIMAQQITSLIALFGEVKAANIVGEEIAGKTIRSNKKISGSNDYTWQITNDGAGHLSQKNISWDAAGNLTVKGTINGSVGSSMGPWNTFASDSVNYIGDGTDYSASKNAFGSDGSFKLGGSQGITKDAAGKIVFGSDVTLEWGEGGDSGGDSSGVTQSEFDSLMSSWLSDSKNDGKINGTKITSNSITTGLIQANAITGDLVKADTIQASKLIIDEVFINKVATALIEADAIKTNKLDTNIDPEGEGKNKGRITIEGNHLTALNNKMNEEVLFISGGSMGEVPSKLSTTSNGLDLRFNSNVMPELYEQSGRLFSDWQCIPIDLKGSPIGQPNVIKNADPNYIYDIDIRYDVSINYGMTLTGEETSTPEYALMFTYNTTGEAPSSNETGSVIMSANDYPLVAGSSSYSNTEENYSIPISHLDRSDIEQGTLYVYFRHYYAWEGNNSGNEVYCNIGLTPRGVTLTPRVKRTDISASGFRSIINANQYLTSDSTGVVARYGDVIFKIGYVSGNIDGSSNSKTGAFVSGDAGLNWKSLITT